MEILEGYIVGEVSTPVQAPEGKVGSSFRAAAAAPQFWLKPSGRGT